ncbi:hypothetical protein VTI74DRAFT_2592 [Chaetomium olivicolor]
MLVKRTRASPTLLLRGAPEEPLQETAPNGIVELRVERLWVVGKRHKRGVLFRGTCWRRCSSFGRSTEGFPGYHLHNNAVVAAPEVGVGLRTLGLSRGGRHVAGFVRGVFEKLKMFCVFDVFLMCSCDDEKFEFWFGGDGLSYTLSEAVETAHRGTLSQCGYYFLLETRVKEW